MQLLLDQVEAIKDHVKQLAEEVEIEKINSTEAADELSSWEERVKGCKETQTVLNQEKVTGNFCTSKVSKFFNFIFVYLHL